MQAAEKGKMNTNNNGEETNTGKQDGKYSNNPMTQQEPTVSSLVQQVKSPNLGQYVSQRPDWPE